MRITFEKLLSSVGEFFTGHSFSSKKLNQAFMVLFVGMMLPLFIIAFYNYPADDDFAFALPTATVWLKTGSLIEVAKSILHQVKESYYSTHGVFIASLISFSTSPLIWGMQYYFLSTWLLLTALSLSVAYFIKSLVYSLLKMKRGGAVLAFLYPYYDFNFTIYTSRWRQPLLAFRRYVCLCILQHDSFYRPAVASK